MPAFGRRSEQRLITCHESLRLLFRTVVQARDCAIVCGRRGRDEQERAFDQGLSQLHYPDSNHNAEEPELSRAVDVAPWIAGGIPWRDGKAFIYFAGYVSRVADELGIPVRWGGDWDGDLALDDQRLNDYPHFELVRGWEPLRHAERV